MAWDWLLREVLGLANWGRHIQWFHTVIQNLLWYCDEWQHESWRETYKLHVFYWHDFQPKSTEFHTRTKHESSLVPARNSAYLYSKQNGDSFPILCIPKGLLSNKNSKFQEQYKSWHTRKPWCRIFAFHLMDFSLEDMWTYPIAKTTGEHESSLSSTRVVGWGKAKQQTPASGLGFLSCAVLVTAGPHQLLNTTSY